MYPRAGLEWGIIRQLHCNYPSSAGGCETWKQWMITPGDWHERGNTRRVWCWLYKYHHNLTLPHSTLDWASPRVRISTIQGALTILVNIFQKYFLTTKVIIFQSCWCWRGGWWCCCFSQNYNILLDKQHVLVSQLHGLIKVTIVFSCTCLQSN